MKGSVVHRGKNRWALVYYVPTREGRRRQKWETFHGTQKQADAALTTRVNQINNREWVAPSKLAFGPWLDRWMESVVKPARRPRTVKTYQSVITSLKAKLGHLLLQELQATDLMKYYAQTELMPSTKRLHHNVVGGALKSAAKQKLVMLNVAKLVEGLPRVERNEDDLEANVWVADEARRFLAAAKAAGDARDEALFALLLDSGIRISECLGLLWKDVDLTAATVKVQRQLVSQKLQADGQPLYGPPKHGRSRTIDLGDETVSLLRAHRSAQSALKLKNRPMWDEFGLVFTKEQADMLGRFARLGRPLQTETVRARFERLMKAAEVKRITIHGTRHTCATLLLAAGEPVTSVSTRLGHKRTSITLDVYGHFIPSMGKSAAATLGALLHGSKG